MDSKIKIEEPTQENDYFPSLFTNKDNTVIILADGRTGDKSFSGMIIHSENKTDKTLIGKYSTGWTYAQFRRFKKRTSIDLNLIQGEL